MPQTQRLERFVAAMPSIPDAVISIGGGSTADSAKAAVALWIYGTCDGVGLGAKRGMKPLPGRKKPLLVGVPTTAGTGADASRYYVTYDEHTRGKVYGRAFLLTADWILMDPLFLDGMPLPLVVAGAFDTFLHLFESLVARLEASAHGEMLSIDGIARVVAALDRICYQGWRTSQQHEDLLYASVMGGVAISNVRTGNIHEAAGALLERTDLSHPETLFVFVRTAFEQYEQEILGKTERLLAALRARLPHRDWGSLDDILRFWEQLFDDQGLTARIRQQVGALGERRAEAETHIFQRVASDRVWMTKESPVALDEDAVRRFVVSSLDLFSAP
jgi:alcohol dehydrogenase class IV